MTIEAFTESGTWDWEAAGSPAIVDVLIVGGGGGGGSRQGGGGGAGGVRRVQVPVSGNIPVVVGSGGDGGINGGRGTSGENSSFGDLVSLGGGAGGGRTTNRPGLPGGSGGGATSEQGDPHSGGDGEPGQGHKGGDATNNSGGGGGGAGEPGEDGDDTNAQGGNGGDGLFFEDFASFGDGGWFGGGGGGAGVSATGDPDNGGQGGGGGGSGSGTGGSGAPNTGSGGGGGSEAGGGGDGGDGVVIVIAMAGHVRSFVGAAPPRKLSGAISDSAMEFTLDDGTGYPDGTDGPFTVALSRGQGNEEKVLCSARAGNVFTVQQRGFDDTTPQAHDDQTDAWHVLDAAFLTQAAEHLGEPHADPAHTHLHDHDDDYAPTSHSHVHNHDGSYAPTSHKHPHVHDEYEALGHEHDVSFDGAHGFLGSPQSIPDDTEVAVVLDSQEFDTDDYLDGFTAGLVMPADGWYEFVGQFVWEGAVDGIRWGTIYRGDPALNDRLGRTVVPNVGLNTLYHQAATGPVFLNEGEQVMLGVRQNSGADLDLLAGARRTFLSARRVDSKAHSAPAPPEGRLIGVLNGVGHSIIDHDLGTGDQTILASAPWTTSDCIAADAEGAFYLGSNITGQPPQVVKIGPDGTEIWRINLWDYVPTLDNRVTSVTVSPDGRYLVAGTIGGTTGNITALDIQASSLLWSRASGSGSVKCVMSPDTSWVWVGSSNHNRGYDMLDGSQMWTNTRTDRGAAAFHPSDSEHIYVGGVRVIRKLSKSDGSVMWSGNPIPPSGSNNWVSGIAVSPDKQWVYALYKIGDDGSHPGIQRLSEQTGLVDQQITLTFADGILTNGSNGGSIHARGSAVFGSVATGATSGGKMFALSAADLTDVRWVEDAPASSYDGNTAMLSLSGSPSSPSPIENSWDELPAMPDVKTAAAGIALNDDEYFVMAGNTDATYRYSITAGAWSTRANLPVRLGAWHSAAMVGGLIYLPQRASTTRRLDIYDPATDTWSTGATPPNAIIFYRTVAVGTKIYVFSGNLSKVQIYDTLTDAWSESVSLWPTPRYAMAAGVDSSGRVHLVAGSTASNLSPSVSTHERYDPTTDSWETLAPYPLGVIRLSGVWMKGRMLCFGGSGPTDEVYGYNADSDTWESYEPVSTGSNFEQAIVLLEGGKAAYQAGGRNPTTGNASNRHHVFR